MKTYRYVSGYLWTEKLIFRLTLEWTDSDLYITSIILFCVLKDFLTFHVGTRLAINVLPVTGAHDMPRLHLSRSMNIKINDSDSASSEFLYTYPFIYEFLVVAVFNKCLCTVNLQWLFFRYVYIQMIINSFWLDKKC